MPSRAALPCFGERFNLVALPIIVGQLMRLRGLRVAPGKAGRLRYEGPLPDALMVLWDGPAEAVTPKGTPVLARRAEPAEVPRSGR